MKHEWHIKNGGGSDFIGGTDDGITNGEDDYGFITNATTKINAKGEGIPWW
ncbi:hypothetical protein LCGC14_1753200 [marine sediment metagenome]|uniref:Uncharacterized protein n=1 Tax=marine sediment metagenome TaxID=412755 RepID=A0A0F9JID1_9ZZZZ